MQRELNYQFVHYSVDLTNKKLKKLGFKPKINPRNLNLFYFNKDKRERIIFDNDLFKIDKRVYDKKQIQEELNISSEKFSPNVLMRPLFQETILPNIVYIGGPSEITYWMQLKNTFNEENLNFPVLILRDHFTWIDRNIYNKWINLGFNDEDLSLMPNQLIKKYLLKSNKKTISLNKENELLNKISSNLIQKSKFLDNNLEPMIEASIKRIKNNLDSIQTKFLQVLKRREEQKIRQINKISNLIHFNGTLNERIESFIPFFIKENSEYIKKLKKFSNPKKSVLKILFFDN